MPIQFDHHLVFARDKHESAQFLTKLLGLPEPIPSGMFVSVRFDNAVTIHFVEPQIDFPIQHYAFLVDDDSFDAIFARIQADGMQFWADPRCQLPGEINHNNGGRGCYFLDPSGHGLEILTRPETP
ncbi:MAG TPA: VOC family protein [Herpetosiphonaceae bacterium]